MYPKGYRCCSRSAEARPRPLPVLALVNLACASRAGAPMTPLPMPAPFLATAPPLAGRQFLARAAATVQRKPLCAAGCDYCSCHSGFAGSGSPWQSSSWRPPSPSPHGLRRASPLTGECRCGHTTQTSQLVAECCRLHNTPRSNQRRCLSHHTHHHASIGSLLRSRRDGGFETSLKAV